MKIKIKAKKAFAMAGALVDAMSDEDRRDFARQLLVRLPDRDLAIIEQCIPVWRASPGTHEGRARAAMSEMAEDKAKAIMTKGLQQSSPQPAFASTASSGSENAAEALSPLHRGEEADAPEHGARR